MGETAYCILLRGVRDPTREPLCDMKCLPPRLLVKEADLLIVAGVIPTLVLGFLSDRT